MAIHMMDPRKVMTKNFLASCGKEEWLKLKASGSSEGALETGICPAQVMEKSGGLS